jgi:hypothetical protein
LEARNCTTIALHGPFVYDIKGNTSIGYTFSDGTLERTLECSVL